MDKTLAKGMAVMEYLVAQGTPCGVSDVARAMGLARSNAHRTLQTLVALGYARQFPDASYGPTLKLFGLGAQVVGGLDVKRIAQPVLAALAQESQETIHLVVREGAEVIYLDKFDSPQPVAAYSKVGGRAAAQCVATGKALLAWQCPAGEAGETWLRRELPVLTAYTPKSHQDYESLVTDLRETRTRGYAFNHEEWRLGVCGLGAPIFDSQGRLVAALGMSVPSIRFISRRVPTLAAALCRAAAATSAALGHEPGVTGEVAAGTR
ncbi:IclR family transcriptional regulator [Imbroritus primus]|uniref:IclR family transcriptional regulator n=1 Tax=Imbroritus primus TaxID=3058603 RepID=UPI003D160A51